LLGKVASLNTTCLPAHHVNVTREAVSFIPLIFIVL